MDPDAQRFRAVAERDIDLLLVEELVVCESFRGWLLEQFGYEGDSSAEFLDAKHSVADSQLGETDVAFGVDIADNTVLVLLENKIDAVFQPDQLKRYRARGQQALEREWTTFHTGLVAPKSYLDGFDEQELVDATITYEAIWKWFRGRGTQRADYKASLLSVAIERSRRATSSEPDEAVTELHRRYWERAREGHPYLGVEEPDGVPKKNLWIRFNPEGLPGDVKLRHKMRRGYVDLEFRNTDREEFTARYRPLLEADMRFDGTENSTFVRIDVPAFSEDTAVRQQDEGIRAGLAAADHLLTWYEAVGRDPQAHLEAAIDHLLSADDDLVSSLDPSYARVVDAMRNVH